MKIVMVSADNSKEVLVGGKHIHQELFEKGLIELGHQVDLIYPTWPLYVRFFILIDKILRKFSAIGNGRFFVNQWMRLGKGLFKKLCKHLEQSSVDLIICQEPLSAYWIQRTLSFTNRKIPVFGTVHGYYGLELTNYVSQNPGDAQIIKKHAAEIEQAHAQICSGLVAVDTRIKSYLQNEVHFNKPISIQFNAIDTKRFSPLAEAEKLQLKTKLGIESKFSLLIARRLVKKNGVAQALEALNELKKQNKTQIHFLIAGDGPEEQSLMSYVTNHHLEGQVSFLGAINHHQILEYYQAVDAVGLPSTLSDGVEEATSLSMLEGMSCGNPVVATAIGGLKEVIKHEQTGLLVEDKKPIEFAAAILRLAENSSFAKQLGEAASIYANNHHGYLNHAKEYLQFVEKVLNESSK